MVARVRFPHRGGMNDTTQTPTDPVATEATDEPTEETTHRRPKRLERNRNGTGIAGVSRALAERHDVPVWLVRAAFVLTSIGGGFGIAAYAAAIVLIPTPEQDRAPAIEWMDRLLENDLSPVGWMLVGAGALVLLAAVGGAAPLVIATALVVAGVAAMRRDQHAN